MSGEGRELQPSSKVVWTTKEGKRIPISKMSDSHLLNTIKFLERKSDAFDIIPPMFQGEMAQYYADQEYDDAMEHRMEILGMVELMKVEANKRGIR